MKRNPKDEALISRLVFRTSHSWDANGTHFIRVSAFDPERRMRVATAKFHAPGGGRSLRPSMVDTEPGYRRRGVMSAIYDHAERSIGRVEPGYSQSDAARALWAKRLGNPRKKKGDPDLLHRLAVEYFGTTENPYEAGFIMSDGTMLDLSGKNDGGDGGVRARDHREVSSVVFEAGYPRRKEDEGSGTPAMFLFMQETGAIRFSRHAYGPRDRSGSGGDAMIQVARKPTVVQAQAVARACIGCTYVRVSYGQDRELVEIEPATPGRVRMVLEAIQ